MQRVSLRSAALAGILGWVLLPAVARATIIYSEDFESYGVRDYPDSVWTYQGPGNTTATFLMDVADGAQGSAKSAVHTVNSAAEIGTNWYFFAGIGRSDMGGVGPGAPANLVQYSMDIKPHAIDGRPTPGLRLNLSQWDPGSSSNAWGEYWDLSLPNDAWSHVSVTLDTGTPWGSNTLPYDPSKTVSLNALEWNSGGFPLGDGNYVKIDNLLLEVIPEPASIGLLAIAGLMALRRR